MKSVNDFVSKFFTDAGEPNGRGNLVKRGFMPSERYKIDFAADFASEGWEQFDTDQDAWYFGVWFNRRTLQTLTYAEGDWTLVNCPDAEHYNAEVRDAIRFYGEGFIAKAIDGSGSMTTYVQNRSGFLIAQLDTGP